MKKWKLAAIGLLVGLALVMLVFAVDLLSATRAARYRATLEQTVSTIVSLNEPFAMAFMTRQIPSLQEVAAAQSHLVAKEQELKALGQPPPELAEVHTQLLEAVDLYEEAFDGLMDNLEAGLDPPFDVDFIAAASQAGERIHFATQALNLSLEADRCDGSGRFLPSCWLNQ